MLVPLILDRLEERSRRGEERTGTEERRGFGLDRIEEVPHEEKTDKNEDRERKRRKRSWPSGAL